MVTRAVSGPSEPLASPDSKAAIWSAGSTPGRILYGQPGAAPWLALACETVGKEAMIRISRLAPADEGAGAMLALIGNGHRARLAVDAVWDGQQRIRSEEHTSELQSLMRISYAVFCLKKKITQHTKQRTTM